MVDHSVPSDILVDLSRRMRRWIQEKHLREKNTNTVRRHRHKSLGDVDTVPKNKRQLLPHSVQNDIPSFKDVKNFRQCNTSPARSRRSIHDCKNVMPKAAIKRNLFGEQNEDEMSAILAKQLTDSPQNQQSYSFLMDPAIQSVKCNDFSYKAEARVLSMEPRDQISREFRNAEFPDGNLKSLLFGKAVNKLQTDLKAIPSPLVVMNSSASRFVPINHVKAQNHSMEYRSMTWANFKFDKQAILDCL